MATRHINVGIDVGSHSVGLAAIEVDGNGVPTRVLSALSHIHDSGLDKDGAKNALTRRNTSGAARRTRRLIRRRRRRLKNLDDTLQRLGYPVPDYGDDKDPYLIWRVRAELADHPLPEEARRPAIAMAVRHIARHRGWRNPYTKAESLLEPAPDSSFMEAVRNRITERTGEILEDGLTPGQIMQQVALTRRLPMRGQTGLLGKIHQSDNANEIRRICAVQGVSDEDCRAIILAVFAAESPRGSAVGRVGRDPLPGQEALPRAPKCDPEFQRYRIISITANLRIHDNGEARPLSADERRGVVSFLLGSSTDDPGWDDVSDLLGIARQDLHGTARLTADGERSAARPPIDATDRVVRRCPIKALQSWWAEADTERRSAMVHQLYEATEDSECAEFLSSLSEKEQGALDKVHLPVGRAAYSRDSLTRLNEHMLTTTDDLHQARKAVFGVDDGWVPPAEPIGTPVGNPAVDRTVKVVARFLNAVKDVYGVPERIQVEHVRDGFVSERMAREIDLENKRRFEQNQRTIAQIHEALGRGGEVRRSDVIRYEAITLQDSKCLYCGNPIGYDDAELDHIVPQAGPGSNNHRENLVAVCGPCNQQKSKKIFSEWATSCDRPGVSVEAAVKRVRAWRNRPESMDRTQLSRLKKDVITRLRRTREDPPIDERSMESVAWMANELRHRIAAAFPEPRTQVAVYRGSVTAAARRAAGIDSRVNLLGEKGRKDRLDRRHHAVDAAVVALMRPGIAKTLAERSSLRWEQLYRRENQTWRDNAWLGPEAREKFEQWKNSMLRLVGLLNAALAEDTIYVTENIRLRLGDGAAHDDTIRSLGRVRLGDGLTAAQVDRASSEALWCALTRQPDYDQKKGLPADPQRVIRVHGTPVRAEEQVTVFTKDKKSGSPTEKPFAAIPVHGGYAEISSTIHHARIYRIEGRKPAYAMLRVFSCDLQRHRTENLFAAEVLPQSISMRCAEPKLRAALRDQTATYLGWVVVGDELEVPMSGFSRGKIGDFLAEYPDTYRWRVHGFYSESQLRLRPSQMAAEGLPDDAPDAVHKTLGTPGWVIAVNALGASHPRVIRRDALGRPRTASTAGLPVSWRIE
ncbi:HNH endonuclease [Actinomyces lilanjuaniae]|uniref:HNH endonuclease n=1 Tax=Actinomyces lilanjuaniae TaxID=2321394 RepID=A0ABN5PPY9_9ACTO|nr:type II CRISPR RNA-guided endonuclease Cas9 [Actinomyces lilanjuaniae]AYD89104.1 HNH endonuclease [Actinomyces lilanjuaniae]